MSDDIEKLIAEIRGADGGHAELAALSGSSERTWEDELRRRGSGFTRTTVHQWLWRESVFSAPKIEALTWGPRSIYLVTEGYFEGYTARLTWHFEEALNLWEEMLDGERLRFAKQPDGTYWSYTRITVYKPSARGIQAESLPPSLHNLTANLHSLHLTLLAVSLLGSQDLLTLRCAPGPWLTAADESARKCHAAYKYPKAPSAAAWRASIIITTREQHESWLRAVPEEAGRPVSVVPWGGPLLDPDDLDVIRRAGAVLTQA